MGTMADGVRQAVENCLKVKAGERAVIITDIETREIGDALCAAVQKRVSPVARPSSLGQPGPAAPSSDKPRATSDESLVEFFVMEDFGTRPIPFPPAIAQAMSKADVSIYAAQGAKGELATFRQPMIKAIEANKKLRHAHMIGITKEIMCDGMCSDYVEIQRVSRLVYERVGKAKAICVATEKGCDFTAKFSPELAWSISDGDIHPGRWKNLPDGEVFTAPANLNGTVVIDGCLGDFFTEKYGSLTQTPVTVEVKDGRAIRETLHCDNEQLLAEFGQYVFETDANSSRVGEFAIGTNTGLTKLIYNLLQDEKFPGVHIAFGSPLPGKTGAKWDSKAHVDGVIIAPTITVDGNVLMDNGQFRL